MSGARVLRSVDSSDARSGGSTAAPRPDDAAPTSRQIAETVWLAAQIADRESERADPEINAAKINVGLDGPYAGTVSGSSAAPLSPAPQGGTAPPGPQRPAEDAEAPGSAPQDSGAADARPRPPAESPDPASVGSGTRRRARADLLQRREPAPGDRTGAAPADAQEDRPGHGAVVDLFAPSADLRVPPPIDQLGLERALRVFQRSVPSRHERDLDEEATAERAARDRLWLPVWEPARERAHGLLLLVDDGLSMLVHEPETAAVVELLQTRGPFEQVRIQHFDSAAAADRPPRQIAKLVADTDRRDVVLVLSDAVGPGWRSGAVQRWLAEWGARRCVCLLSVLPPSHWHRTSAATRRAVLSRPGGGDPGLLAPNGAYTARLTDPAERPPWRALPAGGSVAIPVVPLHGAGLLRWAHYVADDAPAADYRARVLFADPAGGTADGGPDAVNDDAEDGDDAPERPGAAHPQDLVRGFRSEASDLAFRLAVLLAAVPLSLPAMRVVQRAMLPESGPSHLSEVFCGGLLERERPEQDARRGDRVSFDFLPGVREELLSWGRRSQILRTLVTWTTHFREHVPWLASLESVLADPRQLGALDAVPAEASRHATAVSVSLRSVSGSYLNVSRRLATAVGLTPDSDPRSPAPRGPDAGGPDPSTHDPEMPDMNTVLPDTSVKGAPDPAPPASETPEEPEARRPHSPTPTGAGMAAVRSIPPAPEGGRGPDDPPLIWGNVPPKNHNFTGRESELDQVHQRLSEGTTAVLPQAVHGMGGVGKTQLALEYVYRHQSSYDLIWWVPSSSTGEIMPALIELARELQLPVSYDADKAVPAVIEALRLGRPYRNWLLVFDNADDPAQVQPFFPTNGPGRILVTSRNSDWAGITSALEVDVFKPEESRALIQLRRPDLADADADEVGDVLGHLPLAVEQAAVWLMQTGMPASEYLSLFEAQAAELLSGPAPTQYELPVAAAWNVSLQRLEQSNPAALQLLQVCAFLAAAPIPRRFFTSARNVPAPPELARALGDPIRIGRALREINQFALARLDHRDGTIQMHRLVQWTLTQKMSPQESVDRRHCAHLLLANADPGDPKSPAEWPRYAALLPHVRVSEIYRCDEPWARDLVLNVVRFLALWGDHNGGRNVGRRSYAQWSQTLGATHPQTVAMAYELGDLLRNLGDFQEAYEMDVHLRDLLMAEHGLEHEDTLSITDRLSWDLRIRGEFTEALKLNEATQAAAKRVFGAHDPIALTLAHVYGVALRHAGRFADALANDEQVYQLSVESLGEDHPNSCGSTISLAQDLLAAGGYLEARNSMEELVTRMRRLFGDTASNTMAAVLVLSVAQRRTGRHGFARELSEEALRHYRDRYGDNDPDTAQAASCHMLDLHHTGEHAAALELAQFAKDAYHKLYGPRHPQSACVDTNLAILLRNAGRAPEARALNTDALKTLTETLGAGHGNTISCAVNLGCDLAALGESEAARDLDEHTVRLCEESLPSDHPVALAAHRNLALSREALDPGSVPESEFADLMRRYREVFGTEHPATLSLEQRVRADCDIFTMGL
ncbi:hypothetical protein HDA32_003706 [Spinactinospora alkalitolerans]|uniref:NB-ARC domain-containing protein n=1 Tax=Spinactinospora alkalitolerans TaxID=687207 RepID=A0A852TVR8_9ACTN|nr:FxSxx-COOH system tetratricopeptide repeat protein [Spinactinospora alkalitolerans]NYE48586.1 hypothetical protein [Spinactinospora alkalitolerans]